MQSGPISFCTQFRVLWSMGESASGTLLPHDSSYTAGLSVLALAECLYITAIKPLYCTYSLTLSPFSSLRCQSPAAHAVQKEPRAASHVLRIEIFQADFLILSKTCTTSG